MDKNYRAGRHWEGLQVGADFILANRALAGGEALFGALLLGRVTQLGVARRSRVLMNSFVCAGSSALMNSTQNGTLRVM